MDPLARVEVQDRGGFPIACVDGEIDTSNIEEVEAALRGAVSEQATGLIVDLSAVTYLNSATIKLLFDLAQGMRGRQQQLHIVVADWAPMRNLLLLTKLDTIIPVHNSVGEAVVNLRAQASGSGTVPPW